MISAGAIGDSDRRPKKKTPVAESTWKRRGIIRSTNCSGESRARAVLAALRLRVSPQTK